MKLPIWLYESRTLGGVRYRRVGHQKRTWAVAISIDMPADGVRPTWIAQIRPFCVSWGPSESVAEGFASLAAETPRRIFRGRRRAVGIALYGRETAS